jgi:hypothetical protein
MMKRIKEPSTHAGIAALLAAVAPLAGAYSPVVQGFAGLFASFAVAMREGV